MENKIDLKKAIVLGLIVCLVVSAVFLFINYKEYRKYTEVFNLKLNEMVGSIKESYPDASVSEIIEILNKSIKADNELKEYGIDLSKDSMIAENDIHFKRFLRIEGMIFGVLFLSLSAIFLGYNYKKDKKLKEGIMH